jgi:hypothetical protein
MDDKVVRRNEEELTDEDITKNLCWTIMGQTGMKKE